MTRPLDVLVVAPHAVHGGQEEWLLQLLAATDRLVVRVLLLQDGPLRAVLESRGMPVEVLPVGTRPVDLALPVARLAARLRVRRPDVVLANGVKGQFVAGPAARLAGVPLVFVRHDHAFEGAVGRLARLGRPGRRHDGGGDGGGRARGRRRRAPTAPAGPSAAAARCPAAAARARDAGGHRSGARDVHAAGAVQGRRRRGARPALPGGQSWRLAVLGGEDPAAPGEADRLCGLARELGVADRVQLLGYVPGAAELVAGFDALAVLTKTGSARDPGREGFGMAALEAMTAGNPVVAVGGGAIERRLAGRAGVVVPMAAPDAVAAALALLSEPAERAARGAAGRELVRDHPDAAASAGRLVGVLAEAARRPGAGLAPVDPVSVVVPVYDEGPGVDDIVTAVTAQLRPGDELVVVDDASRDDTAARLAALAERLPQLRVLALPRNGGAAAARNAGIAAAAHELVVCADAGNDLPVGWLAAMRTALAETPPADLVAGAYRVSMRTPWEAAMAVALYPDVRDVQYPGPLVRWHARLFGRSFVAERPIGRSIGFRRPAWERVGGFPAHLRAAEDTAFGLAVARQGRCVLQVDDPVLWRQHSGLRATARMYASYGRGDGLQGERVVVARNALRAAAALGTPVVLAAGGARARAAVAAGALAYLGLPLWHARRAPRPLPTAALVPVALVTKDLAKAYGCACGLLQARREARGTLKSGPWPPTQECPGSQGAGAQEGTT